CSDHATANVNANGCRNDSTHTRKYAAHGSTNPKVRIGHGGDMVIYERHLGEIDKLLNRCFFNRNPFPPQEYRLSSVTVNYVKVTHVGSHVECPSRVIIQE